MREYGKIFSAIWRSNDFRALSEDGQKMAMYLLTSQHATMIGCYYLPYGYIAEDMGWEDMARVEAAMADCIDLGFAQRDPVSRFVFVSKWLKWNPFENPNVAKSANRTFEMVPAALRYHVAQAILQHCPKHIGEEATALYLAIEPTEIPKVEPKLKTVKTVKAAPAPAPADKPAEAPTTAQKAAATKAAATEAKAAETWEAYKREFRLRYNGTNPVRNAMVNTLMAKFVDRVGKERAPHVAAFFVRHNQAFYVRSMHAVNALHANAETLCAEWERGRAVTQTEAREADRRQTSTGFLASQLVDEPTAPFGDVIDMETTP